MQEEIDLRRAKNRVRHLEGKIVEELALQDVQLAAINETQKAAPHICRKLKKLQNLEGDGSNYLKTYTCKGVVATECCLWIIYYAVLF